MSAGGCNHTARKRGSVEVNDGHDLPIAKRIKGLTLE